MPQEIYVTPPIASEDWVYERLKPVLNAGQHDFSLDADRSDGTVLVQVDGLSGEPVRVDLRDDQNDGAWNNLLDACGLTLGTTVPKWLQARDSMLGAIGAARSVHLLVRGQAAWRPLIEDVQRHHPDLARIDLRNLLEASDQGLVRAILRARTASQRAASQHRTDEIPVLGALDLLADEPRRSLTRLAVTSLDAVTESFDFDLNTALKALSDATDELQLVVQSQRPLMELVPDGKLADVAFEVVEL